MFQKRYATLFDAASPTTLASLIADIQALGTGAERDALRLEREALAVLVAKVGETEADTMVTRALDAAYADG